MANTTKNWRSGLTPEEIARTEGRIEAVSLLRRNLFNQVDLAKTPIGKELGKQLTSHPELIPKIIADSLETVFASSAFKLGVLVTSSTEVKSDGKTAIATRISVDQSILRESMSNLDGIFRFEDNSEVHHA